MLPKYVRFVKQKLRGGTDSVKVCPDCGTEYHEACWNANNGCIACSEHHVETQADTSNTEAESVSPVNDVQISAADESENAAIGRKCIKCGAVLQDGQKFCPACGQKVADISDAHTPTGTKFSVYVKKNCSDKKKLCIIGAAAALVVIIAVVLIILLCNNGGKKKDFNDMYGDISGEAWCTIASDGSYIKIDTNPYDTDSDDMTWTDYELYFFPADDAIQRVNEELGFSEAVYEKMNTTTWSQGKQTDSNEKYIVTYTYHPDKGLEVMYEFK